MTDKSDTKQVKRWNIHQHTSAMIDECDEWYRATDYDALVAENERLRTNLADATHRVHWMLQYLRDIDVATIEAEVARWDALCAVSITPKAST